jgi:MFS family permease
VSGAPAERAQAAAPVASRAARSVARGSLRVYAAAFFAYFAFAAVFQILPPFLPKLARQLHVTSFAISLTMTSFLAPLVATSFLFGWAADRYGQWRVGAAGGAVFAAGGWLTLTSHSFGALLAWRAVAGLGGGMMVVATLRMLATTLPVEKLGGAFGVFIAGLPAGTGADFLGFRHLGAWRPDAVAADALATFGAVAFLLLAPKHRSRAAPRRTPPSPLSQRDREIAATLRHLALLVAVGYTAIIAFTTWAPTRLKGSVGLSPSTTTTIAALLLLIDLPFAPLWGRVSDIAGRRKPFVVGSFVVYGAGAVALAIGATRHGYGLAPLFALPAVMGVGCAMFFPATLAIPPGLVAREQVGRCYGLFLTAQAAGMAAGPLLLGLVFARAGTQIGFLAIAALSWLGFLIGLPLRAR